MYYTVRYYAIQYNTKVQPAVDLGRLSSAFAKPGDLSHYGLGLGFRGLGVQGLGFRSLGV